MNDAILSELKKLNGTLVMRAWKAIPRDDAELNQAFDEWRQDVDVLWRTKGAANRVLASCSRLVRLMEEKGITQL